MVSWYKIFGSNLGSRNVEISALTWVGSLWAPDPGSLL